MINTVLITIFCIIVLGSIIVITVDSLRYHIVEYTVTSPKISTPKTFVVMSDLHDMSYGKDNRKLIKSVLNQHPNAILIPGDMITAKPHKKTDRVSRLLGELREKSPIFYSLGNHEYRTKIYPKVYGTLYQDYELQLQKSNIHMMDNETEDMEEIRFTALTIDREFYKRKIGISMDKQYLDQTIGTPESSKFTILLAHNPDYFETYAKWGADLVLAGHIHGGVIRIPGSKGVISPTLSLFPKYDGGRFQKDQCTMIVSRGLGMHTIPFRMFNPAELIVLKVMPTKD